MSRDHSKDVIVALDIGTSTVVAIVAECLPDGRYEVIGVGQSLSRGMRRGVVVNIEQIVGSIQQALEEACLMADFHIREVYTGIGGNHINSFNSSGMVAVVDKEVSYADVRRVLDTAKAVNIANDHEILHVITQQYTLDKQEGIIQPVGMAGIRLEVRVHIITGLQSATQNVVKCIRRCGLEIRGLVFQALAASQVCLTADEKELGVALVDIGSGTTDLAVWHGGALRHTAVIPQGGDQITNDIATMLRTPTPDAEDIKLNYGAAKASLVNVSETFEVIGLGNRESREMERHVLAQVIEPRVEEILMGVMNEIAESGHKVTGLVLTGGTALLPGIQELAEDMFQVPVRIGVPIYDGSLSDVVCEPRFATAMGLLSYSLMQQYAQHGDMPKEGLIKRLWRFITNSL